MSARTTLIGIDPGLEATGWGVIGVEGSRLSHIANGTVRSNARRALAERLVELELGIAEIVTRFAPDGAAVETAFVARDSAAALKLGQARAIALLVPARTGIPVAEYAPNQIKKSVVGAGHAAKQQIRAMIGVLLPSCDIHSEHAADALAVAICHAHRSGSAERIEQALARAGGG